MSFPFSSLSLLLPCQLLSLKLQEEESKMKILSGLTINCNAAYHDDCRRFWRRCSALSCSELMCEVCSGVRVVNWWSKHITFILPFYGHLVTISAYPSSIPTLVTLISHFQVRNKKSNLFSLKWFLCQHSHGFLLDYKESISRNILQHLLLYLYLQTDNW